MKRILLAVSALAIAGAAALTSANASQGAYAGDCRVIRERIETRRTGQPARLRVIIKAAIPIRARARANADARLNNGAAYDALAGSARATIRTHAGAHVFPTTSIGRRTVSTAMSIFAM